MCDVLSTAYTPCHPRHIKVLSTVYMAYGVENSVACRVYNFICRGSVDSVPYGVDNIYAVCNMPCTTCLYAVGDMGYAVGI